jgi:hypothetical protein
MNQLKYNVYKSIELICNLIKRTQDIRVVRRVWKSKGVQKGYRIVMDLGYRVSYVLYGLY